MNGASIVESTRRLNEMDFMKTKHIQSRPSSMHRDREGSQLSIRAKDSSLGPIQTENPVFQQTLHSQTSLKSLSEARAESKKRKEASITANQMPNLKKIDP